MSKYSITFLISLIRNINSIIKANINMKYIIRGINVTKSSYLNNYIFKIRVELISEIILNE